MFEPINIDWQQLIMENIFKTKEESFQNRYRPCGHCMKKEYTEWILSNK